MRLFENLFRKTRMKQYELSVFDKHVMAEYLLL